MQVASFKQHDIVYDIQPPIEVPDDLQIKSIGHLASYGFEEMGVPGTLSPSRAHWLKPEQKITELEKLEKQNENARAMYRGFYEQAMEENPRLGLLALNHTMNSLGLRHKITVVS